MCAMWQDRATPTFVALVQATGGAAGGIFAAFTLMPIEVAKTRIQIGASKTASTAGTISEIWQAQGVQGLYRGVGAKCWETGSRNFVYFYIYDALNEYAKQQTKVTAGLKLIIGYVAGVWTTTTTMPLEVMSTKLQAGTVRGNGMLASVRNVIADQGLAGLFKGFWWNIALCINPAIANSVFDRIKERLLQYQLRRGERRPSLSPFQAFLMGAFAKAIATVVTFPMVRMKTILQAGTASAEDHKSTSKEGLSVFERVASLYKGLNSALYKSVLQAALLYMTKDQVEQFVIFCFRLSNKMMRRRDGSMKLAVTSGRPV